MIFGNPNQFTIRLSLIIITVLECSCGISVVKSKRPSPKAISFFTDYVKYDGPAPNTLPVFLNACNGDEQSLDQIFGDYGRFGSGDNEAWFDVPGKLLEELGDQKFSQYVKSKPLHQKKTLLKYLGSPDSTLYEDSTLKLLYPYTSELQRALFESHPDVRP